jgi:hypothetical protein
MTPIQESRERKAIFAPPRNAQPLPGEGGGGWAAWLNAVRNGGWFLLLFMTIGLAMFAFGVAGTFGPYRDGLRENGDPRFFYAMMAMGALFALIALRMLQVAATGSGHELRRMKTRVDPRQPWTGDYPWKPAGQDPEGAGSPGGMILGRVAFLGFIAFFNLAWTSGQLAFRIVIVVLDLFALLIIYDSLQKLWQGLRYARPRILWLTFPAFTGSRLEASFRSRRRLHVTGPVRVTLRCVEDGWRERPNNEPSQLEPFQIYEQVTEIPLAEDQAWIDSLRIDVAIPEDLPGTDLSKDEAVYWQLLAQVPVLGPDFESVFLAPVYERRTSTRREVS